MITHWRVNRSDLGEIVSLAAGQEEPRGKALLCLCSFSFFTRWLGHSVTILKVIAFIKVTAAEKL